MHPKWAEYLLPAVAVGVVVLLTVRARRPL